MIRLEAMVLSMVLLACCGKRHNPDPIPVKPATTASPNLLSSTDPDAPATGYQLPKTGTLNAIDLANWAKLKRDGSSGDQFHKGFDDGPIAGRKFSVMFDAADAEAGKPGFFYNKERSELNLEVTLSGGASNRGQMIMVEASRHFSSPVQMSNSFGAIKDVTPQAVSQIGMGVTRGHHPGIFVVEDDGGDYYPSFKSLRQKIKLSGDDAQQMTSGMHVIFAGTVEKDKDKNTVECDYAKENATITYPYETTTRSCIVNVHFSRIAFLRSNGSTIKEWNAK